MTDSTGWGWEDADDIDEVEELNEFVEPVVEPEPIAVEEVEDEPAPAAVVEPAPVDVAPETPARVSVADVVQIFPEGASVQVNDGNKSQRTGRVVSRDGNRYTVDTGDGSRQTVDRSKLQSGR